MMIKNIFSKLKPKLSEMEQEKNRIEAEKFKSLSLKKKIEHIWIYYKFPIFWVVLSVIIIYSFLNMYIFNPPKQYFAQISFYGSYLTDETRDTLYDALQAFVNNTEKYEIKIDNYYTVSNDPQLNAAQGQRFAANLIISEFDLIIADISLFDELLHRELFMDLGKVFTEAELEALGDRLIYGNYDHEHGESGEIIAGEIIAGEIIDSGTEQKPFIISLEGSQFFEKKGYAADNLFIGVVSNTKRFENAELILLELIKLE